jgi:Na+-driven multidrug efflux pump
VPLAALLIFGWGPVPAFGIAGGATAFLVYYGAGTVAFAIYLRTGRSVVTPSLHGRPLRWPLFRDILRVGAVAALVTVQTNLTIAIATGLAATFGPAAIAGYGVGSRLEYLLVPLAFGFGAPLVALVGTNLGAGNRARAVKAAWLGAAVVALLTEVIGLTAAAFPHAWLTLFGTDPDMLAAGSDYLRTVGPFYGFFGFGMALYFASQGAGRLKWPLIANVMRLIIAAGGGWLALSLGGNLTHVFIAQSIALAMFGLVIAAAVARGAWF